MRIVMRSFSITGTADCVCLLTENNARMKTWSAVGVCNKNDLAANPYKGRKPG